MIFKKSFKKWGALILDILAVIVIVSMALIVVAMLGVIFTFASRA